MGDLANLAKVDYVDRVNRAIDHVLQHLHQPLRLDDVAQAAHFSPHHFHRVFRALVGETVHDFVKRLRLERALQLMANRPRLPLTEVALACGFSSSSDFSRSFRQRYGVAPRAFDLAQWRRTRRDELQDTVVAGQRHRLDRLPPGENPDGFVVRLRRLPARRVAYLRVHQPYQGSGVLQAVQRLQDWARPRGLAQGQWLGYQWDDPDLVPLAQCRYDVGLEVPAATPIDRAVSAFDFPPMTVAELNIAGPVDLEMRALDWLFGTWLPHSGLAPDLQPCFEAWNGAPFAHGVAHFELRLQLPVVDAAHTP